MYSQEDMAQLRSHAYKQGLFEGFIGAFIFIGLVACFWVSLFI